MKSHSKTNNQRHYTPRISRFLICVLYHEAKRQQIPMTRLVDQLLQQALRNTPGWQQANQQMKTRHVQ
tara:strand:- start:208 stop:411 length:204 start_codon:yes stop_codon:yes gene_type:complete